MGSPVSDASQTSHDPGGAESLVIGPGFPVEWYGWPLEVGIGFTLYDNLCVDSALFKEYSVTTIEDGARVLYNPENAFWMWPIYQLKTIAGVAPAFRWNLTRPLWRRTGDEWLERRGAVPGPSGAPWDFIADDTLLEIRYTGTRSSYDWVYLIEGIPTRRAAMLQVGARTPEEADRTWEQCAKIFRRIYREVTGWGKRDNGS